MHVGLDEPVNLYEGKECSHGEATDIDKEYTILLAYPVDLISKPNFKESLIRKLEEIFIAGHVCSNFLYLKDKIEVDILQLDVELPQLLDHYAISVRL